MSEFASFLSGLARGQKIVLQIAADGILILICFLAAMLIRLETADFIESPQIWLPFALAALLALQVLWFSGLYASIVRFVTGQIVPAVARGAATFAAALFLANYVLTSGIPRSVPLIAAILIFLTISGLRFAMRQMFRRPAQRAKKRVIIYGAGEAGLELLNSLFHGRDYSPAAFVDDNQKLQGMKIGGFRVYPPAQIQQMCDNLGVEAILLAMPTITRKRRQEILDALEDCKLEVKTIPSISDVLNGKAKIAELRDVIPEDLLGRDPVPPNQELLSQNISAKNVMITGAGGSIGSELCRQIIGQNPRSLILYELSEFALYSIEQELCAIAKRLSVSVKIIPLLGCVKDSKRLDAAISGFDVETIYHAAAYKHVPLVEENVVEGIRNNVFGTLALANLARAHSVSDFILISTDKAVRPTNVMGATKRIAELICQAHAQDKSATRFSMVRFGNVLGSSGSVIPRFRSQIEAGGPVTVTHRDINRYFMTIPEASQLVIQAGAMAKGGDVFVLDMGEPVKIADLAATMVKLHGLTPYFVANPDEIDPDQGDIAICFTGLRKGEKLYEELLIGNDPEPTQHPRIMSASEIEMPLAQLTSMLDKLGAACTALDLVKVRAILLDLPIEFRPSHPHLSDLVWQASQAEETAQVPANVMETSR